MASTSTPRSAAWPDIARVAASTGGAITTEELHARGLSDGQIHDLTRDGYLHRVRRGHYLVGHVAVSRHAHMRSLVEQAGPDACLSGQAAIERWGFLPWSARTIDVVTPKPRRPVTGARLQVRQALVRQGATTCEGTRILQPEWAVLAAAERTTAGVIIRIMRAGTVKRALDVDRLRRIADHKGMHGVPVLRNALDGWSAGDRGTWSKYEFDVSAYLPSDVLHGSIANGAITVPGDTIHVDRVWRDLGVCLECDGPLHDDPGQQRIDRLRRAALTLSDWQCHSVHWRAFEHDPHAAVRPIIHAVRAARAARNAT